MGAIFSNTPLTEDALDLGLVRQQRPQRVQIAPIEGIDILENHLFGSLSLIVYAWGSESRPAGGFTGVKNSEDGRKVFQAAGLTGSRARTNAMTIPSARAPNSNMPSSRAFSSRGSPSRLL